MEKIVQGIVFEGNRTTDQWDIAVWEKNGHREVSARLAIEWREVGVLPFNFKNDPFDPVRDAEEIEDRRLRNLKLHAKRAQSQCRRIIKTQGFDTMLTITYRENQEDRALCKVHFKEWVRRMKRAIPNFRYCASFERQERGSMHIHLATYKLPEHADYKGVKIEAWKLGTTIWRSIVGDDNGLVFVGGKTKFGGYRRNLSLAKMAAYVSKYILKDCEDLPSGANRYSRSNDLDVPKSVRYRLSGLSAADIVSLLFEVNDGDVLVNHHLGHWRDSYWLCTEPARSTVTRNDCAVAYV